MYTPGSSPVLLLKVGAQDRIILELYNGDDHIKSDIATTDHSSKYDLTFDYPFTIFLAFALLCAIQAHHNN